MRNDDFRGVSPSQLDAMSCRLAWHLGYRLGYRPRRLNKALDLGTGIHAALEEFYAHKTDPVGAFLTWCGARRAEIDPEWSDDLQDMEDLTALGKSMLEGYVTKYGDDDGLEVIATEHTLSRRIPIPGRDTLSRYTLTARLDGIVRDASTGKLFSLEHKTFSRYNPQHFDLDPQFTSQVWLGRDLAETLGLEDEVIGVIYNGLRKQEPGKRVTSALFVREKIMRTEAQIDSFLRRVYFQCRDFSSKSVAIYPQPSPIRCSGCGFKEVCLSYQRGEDYEFILGEMFVSRAERDAAEEPSED